MLSLCLELQCVNQVICGCVMFILSIWMCAVEHTKSTTLDGKLTVNSLIENSQEKMSSRCLLEYCTVCLEKPGFTHCSDLENRPYQKVALSARFNHWSHIVNNLLTGL